MEQRIGPNIQPLQGAAVDPAFVPGITGPRPAEPKDAEPKDAEPKDAEPSDADPDAGTSAAAEEAASEEPAAGERPAAKVSVSKDPAPEDPASKEEPGTESAGEKPEDADEAPGEEPAPAPDGGPVFEASDRRAKIVADHSGVRLRLDDQEAEFRWDEIGAVETESPRFGKRFTITVHTPDRRWYPIEIEATARSRFAEWETRLDEVLDTYFEEAEESAP
ncbi:hypothetical protein ACH4UV_16505 [Streptomyces sp. NPDC020802]|uniref:hypothetical protein n=1 Tax=Streptomyces sp. NPDC020802 TaxID=3365094 RepID=UPI0037986F11